ncbi:esterase [Paenibacillus jamilae]|uniref:Esterase n=1 Tax=Paenibacillus jamilae TaxID=114136 RepID=A0ACC4ZWS7_9BACL|nr:MULTISPECIES: HEAT repeat domain-containing protein [Paenibacillus]MCV9948701.1 HEAT repeat domain-containing protein [Paenibacillus sp. BT-177]AUO07749.1 HEAT repeat domain-containing protein [Paenibacillus sp. lzh-N1]KTS82654.1 esterase [Paenibacillus jamilae]OAZ49905.1 esterase [Paenibacillus polymyxa]TKH35706.1 HEAT repeat domain-containing protein [Paenibacillus polymyxa]
MENNETQQEFAEVYEQLKVAANRTSDWKARLAAVNELGAWKNQQTIDLLTHRMNNDMVYAVQEAAYHKLQEWGENVQPPVRKEGELVKGLTKILVRIKKSLPADHTYNDFREKLHKMRVDIYDVYEGDKGAEFDQWLEQKWASLSTR